MQIDVEAEIVDKALMGAEAEMGSGLGIRPVVRVSDPGCGYLSDEKKTDKDHVKDLCREMERRRTERWHQ